MEMMQSSIANAINKKDIHSSLVPTISTLGLPLLPNSIVAVNKSTAMDTDNVMTAMAEKLSPGPSDTMESAVAKQNMSRNTLPQVRYILWLLPSDMCNPFE